MRRLPAVAFAVVPALLVLLARPGVARFLARRLAQAVPTVLLIIVVNFLVLHLTPGDIVDVLAGEAGAATPEYVAMLRQRFGLDRPLVAQLASYVWGVVNLDLGFSFRLGKLRLQFPSVASDDEKTPMLELPRYHAREIGIKRRVRPLHRRYATDRARGRREPARRPAGAARHPCQAHG